jgi:hypothetical protein
MVSVIMLCIESRKCAVESNLARATCYNLKLETIWFLRDSWIVRTVKM